MTITIEQLAQRAIAENKSVLHERPSSSPRPVSPPRNEPAVARLRPVAGMWVVDYGGPQEASFTTQPDAEAECNRRVARAGGGFVYRMDNIGLLVQAHEIHANQDQVIPAATGSVAAPSAEPTEPSDLATDSLAEAFRSIDEILRARPSQSGSARGSTAAAVGTSVADQDGGSPDSAIAWVQKAKVVTAGTPHRPLVDLIEQGLSQLGEGLKWALENRDFIKLAKWVLGFR